ncbi:uncharacterized protein DSM5745_05536 [Aspergillus mulundensis]|uniref:glucose oxidase n=1 Tax=Aspergillus mulundensis TaxID=1810919 RepID=A0A3D8RXV5_9EURO|nr:hypothetical protein DSM5745_05536 [Aspergillus mulundensis]RDW78684.1 hypothetical protein DSM5745_05536 [Aspergillus mulundensis]
MISPLLLLQALPLLPLSLSTASPSPPSTTAATYDYIIIGGGTAGLTVANRLSEDPSLSILVIEPGEPQLNNPNVTDISRLAYTYDSPLDWAYETTEQAFGGRRQVMRAGRALGGTSAINGAAYARAERIQLDALYGLGNGTTTWSWSWPWTWERMLPYYKKSETVRAPNASQVAAGASIISGYHGDSGPVQVGFLDMGNDTRHTGDVDGEVNFTTGLNRTHACTARHAPSSLSSSSSPSASIPDQGPPANDAPLRSSITDMETRGTLCDEPRAPVESAGNDRVCNGHSDQWTDDKRTGKSDGICRWE